MRRNAKAAPPRTKNAPRGRRGSTVEPAKRPAPADPSSSTPASSFADDVRLLHELEVYKTELELQNDELRATRLALEKNLGRYTELFDFAPIGYACLHPDDEIRELNLAGASLLGRPRSRLVGRRFGEFVALRSVRAFRELLIGAHEKEIKQTCELELQVGDNPVLQARLTAAPMQLEGGAIMLAFEDITERKHQEVLLAESERALRESDRRKDEFIAVLSHELRNPLAPIRTGLFVLSQVTSDSDEAKAMRDIIDRQVTHLSRLINDLLDASRIRSGKIVLQTECLELASLVRRTVDDHRRDFERRGIALETRIAQDLYVRADPVRLVQVFTNLLGNAEKFTQEGGRVIVSLDRDGSHAVVRVVDSGVGIPRSHLDHVFEPFAQAPQSIERSRGGLGLGLSMVKGVVELHGGRANIWSDGENRGTTVVVELPLVESLHLDEPG